MNSAICKTAKALQISNEAYSKPLHFRCTESFVLIRNAYILQWFYLFCFGLNNAMICAQQWWSHNHNYIMLLLNELEAFCRWFRFTFFTCLEHKGLEKCNVNMLCLMLKHNLTLQCKEKRGIVRAHIQDFHFFAKQTRGNCGRRRYDES